MICKRISGSKGDDETISFEKRSFELAAHQWWKLREQLERCEFWSLSLDGEAHGLDGFRYVVEANLDGKYNVVDRWCPTEGTFADLCQTFLKLHAKAWEASTRRRSWVGTIRKLLGTEQR